MEQEAKMAKEFGESWSAVYEGGPAAKRFPRNGNARTYRPLDAESEENHCGVRHYNSKYGGWSAQQDNSAHPSPRLATPSQMPGAAASAVCTGMLWSGSAVSLCATRSQHRGMPSSEPSSCGQ